MIKTKVKKLLINLDKINQKKNLKCLQKSKEQNMKKMEFI